MKIEKKTWTQIALEKDMNEASVRNIYKDKDKIKAQGMHRPFLSMHSIITLVKTLV